MANRFFNPAPQFFDNDGEMLADGSLSFFLTGTSTPSNTYSDAALAVPNENPLPLDSAGRATTEIFLNPAVSYKAVLKRSDGTTVWTRDPVSDPAANVSASFRVFAGNPNGSVSGNQGSVGGTGASVVWDITNQLLYVCTTTGDAATAVWTQVGAQLGGAVAITGIISPVALAADANNYNPTGFSTATIVRQDLLANVAITGLSGGSTGRLVVLHNISASNLITLPNESASSTAANRFAIPGGCVVYPGQSLTLYYDNSSSRWRPSSSTDTARKITREQTLTDAATITFDMSLGDSATVTLGGNRTLAAPTNEFPYQFGFLRIIQDATGSRTLTWDASYKFEDSNDSTVDPTPSSTTIYFYWVRGSNDVIVSLFYRAQTGAISYFVDCDGDTAANVAATWSASGTTTCTVTSNNHGHLVGHRVIVENTSGGAGPSGYYTVQTVTTNTFTITLSGALTASGNADLQRATKVSSNGVHSVVWNGTTAVYTINLSKLLSSGYAATVSGYTTAGNNTLVGKMVGKTSAYVEFEVGYVTNLWVSTTASALQVVIASNT